MLRSNETRFFTNPVVSCQPKLHPYELLQVLHRHSRRTLQEPLVALLARRFSVSLTLFTVVVTVLAGLLSVFCTVTITIYICQIWGFSLLLVLSMSTVIAWRRVDVAGLLFFVHVREVQVGLVVLQRQGYRVLRAEELVPVPHVGRDLEERMVSQIKNW